MKKKVVSLLFAFALMVNTVSINKAEAEGDYSRYQLSAELLGAGLLYSVFGSYRFMENLAGNLGISFISVSGTSTAGASVSSTLLQFPASVSYLAGGPNSFFEALAGFDFAIASAEVSGSGLNASATGTGFIPQLGVGYRYWPEDGGFHFRATLYGIIASGFFPWFGLSFGYAFM